MPDLLQDVPKPPPHPKSVKVKVIVILAVALVILFCIASVFWLQQKKKTQGPITTPPTSQQTTTPTYKTKLLSSEEITKLLPSDLPLEKDALVLQSSRITDKDSTEQITYQFVTKKTLAENFNLHKSYLENNGWKLLNEINQTDIKSLSAVKETERKTLSITISTNTITSQRIVSISLIIKPETMVSLATVENMLLAKAKISFSQISQQKEITITELPDLLQKFIIQNSQDIKIQKLDYTGQKNGFNITYNIQNISMRDLKSKLSKIAHDNQFQPLAGSRAEIFGFLEYEKELYQLRITYYIEQDSKNIKITLQVIEKK